LVYLYRAVDNRGQAIDFLLSAKRDAEAAKRFFRKVLAQSHTVNPRTITVDKNAAYPRAIAEMKKDGELWRGSRLRQLKYLDNIAEQDHRNLKRLTRPGLGFGGFWTARRTLAGYEAMAMRRKGQVRNIGGRDIRTQGTVIEGGILERKRLPGSTKFLWSGLRLIFEAGRSRRNRDGPVTRALTEPQHHSSSAESEAEPHSISSGTGTTCFASKAAMMPKNRAKA
jgi:hypothetical protein